MELDPTLLVPGIALFLIVILFWLWERLKSKMWSRRVKRAMDFLLDLCRW